MDNGRQRLGEGSLVLGLETSCDETAAAVVLRTPDGRGRIVSNVVRTQWERHRPYGGVVPEIAARAHVECLDILTREAMREAGIAFGDLDAVAATAGPGLIGGLIVGLVTGKAIALAARRPFLAIHHLEAHALTVGLTEGLRPPYLLLLVSGGHTQLLIVRGVGAYARLGTTIDDALGEAFDKTAKLLGLGFPGGPAVEAAARIGNAARFDLPRPMLGREELNFSFAGLKTAVRRTAEKLAPLKPQDVADIAAAFEAAVTEIGGRPLRAGDGVRGGSAWPGGPAFLRRCGRRGCECAPARRLARSGREPRLCLSRAPCRSVRRQRGHDRLGRG